MYTIPSCDNHPYYRDQQLSQEEQSFPIDTGAEVSWTIVYCSTEREYMQYCPKDMEAENLDTLKHFSVFDIDQDAQG
jgi:hypothetical protein